MPRRLFASTYLDHRGVPFTLERRTAIYRRTVGGGMGDYWISWLFTRGVPFFLLACVLLRFEKPLHEWLLFNLGPVVVTLFGLWFVKVALTARMPLQRLSALSGKLIARGLCGACATDLRTTPAAEDGCVACPACHASWRSDALARAAREPRSTDGWERLIASDTGAADHYASDDRAMPLAQSISWPLRWRDDPAVPEATRRAVKAHASLQLRRLLAWLVPVTLLIWCGGLWAYCTISYKSDSGAQAIFSIAMLCVLWFIAYVVIHLWMNKAMHAFASQHLNACNHCGQPLTDSPPEFDGCRVCTKCGAAWKAGAHVSRVVEPATA